MKRTSKPNRLKYTLKSVYAERSSYFMIAPFMIAFIIFTVLPVIASLAFGFTDFNMLSISHFVGWENYERLFIRQNVA